MNLECKVRNYKLDDKTVEGQTIKLPLGNPNIYFNCTMSLTYKAYRELLTFVETFEHENQNRLTFSKIEDGLLRMLDTFFKERKAVFGVNTRYVVIEKTGNFDEYD